MKLVISMRDAVDMLDTSPKTVQGLLESGELPAYREGRNWKIPLSLLEKFVEEKAIAEAAERKSAQKERDTA